jgi:hypothetical protein
MRLDNRFGKSRIRAIGISARWTKGHVFRRPGEGLPAFIPRALLATRSGFHKMPTQKKGRLALKDMKDGKAPPADPLRALNTT